MASEVRLHPTHGQRYNSSVQLIQLTSMLEVQLHKNKQINKQKTTTHI